MFSCRFDKNFVSMSYDTVMIITLSVSNLKHDLLQKRYVEIMQKIVALLKTSKHLNSKESFGSKKFHILH